MSKNALDEAQELMWEVMENPSKSARIKLAERALLISPECADAYTFLAFDKQKSIAGKIGMLEKATEAGRRALDPQLFKNAGGNFWGILETRPFMRALFGLALQLERSGQNGRAISQYEEVLRLNTSDNLGARYQLIPLLIRCGHDNKAWDLIKEYSDDVGPAVTYSRALLLFKREGNSEEAQSAIKEAVRFNRHVIPFLLAPKFNTKIHFTRHVVVGGEEEAYSYSKANRQTWHQTEGAIDSLIEFLLAHFVQFIEKEMPKRRELRETLKKTNL